MVTIVLVPDPALSTTILDDEEIGRTAVALQAWIDREVAPAWSQGPYTVIAVPRGRPAPRGTDHLWLVYLRTNSDVSGAVGYHTLDAQGAPVAHVFVTDAALLGLRWSAVAGHEIAEMMVNRWCSAAVLESVPGAPSAGFAACTMEACDPCEVWSYDFTWEGIQYAVPDFVLPAYFRPGAHGPYDRMGQVPGPLQPARGCRQGYASLAGGVVTISGLSQGCHSTAARDPALLCIHATSDYGEPQRVR
jgi:hypothetical protein